MSKLIFCCALLFSVCSPIWACGSGPTHVEWGAWKIETSENLYSGRKYNSYPLFNLVDGDPKTAWVFSGTGKCWDTIKKQVRLKEEPSFLLILSSKSPIQADELWIRTGFDKSDALWKRNNRVKRMEVTAYLQHGKSPTTWKKNVSLTDTRGWHKIALPQGEIQSLTLNLEEFYRGTDNDIALSELALYRNGKKLDWQLPATVLVDDGSQDDGCGLDPNKPNIKPQLQGLVSVQSKKSVLLLDYSELERVWSESGRYVAGVSYDETAKGEKSRIWLFDAQHQKLLWRKPAINARFVALSWRGERLDALYSPLPSPENKRQPLIRHSVFNSHA